MASSSDNFKQFGNPLYDKLKNETNTEIVLKELLTQVNKNQSNAFGFFRNLMFHYPEVWKALVQTLDAMRAVENINFLIETYNIRTTPEKHTIQDLYKNYISQVTADPPVNFDSEDVKLFEKGMNNEPEPDQRTINQAIESMNKHAAKLIVENIQYKVEDFKEKFKTVWPKVLEQEKARKKI